MHFWYLLLVTSFVLLDRTVRKELLDAKILLYACKTERKPQTVKIQNFRSWNKRVFGFRSCDNSMFTANTLFERIRFNSLSFGKMTTESFFKCAGAPLEFGTPQFRYWCTTGKCTTGLEWINFYMSRGIHFPHAGELKRLVTILGITACICMYPWVDSISAIFSMAPQNSVKTCSSIALICIFVVVSILMHYWKMRYRFGVNQFLQVSKELFPQAGDIWLSKASKFGTTWRFLEPFVRTCWFSVALGAREAII